MPLLPVAGAGERPMKFVPSLFVFALSIVPAFADNLPKFQVDASWPKTLPNNWIMGQAAGVAVDAQEHIWVIQRPRTLTDDEKAEPSIRRAPSAVGRHSRCWNLIPMAIF